MNPRPRLRPCPFCGGPAFVRPFGPNGSYFVAGCSIEATHNPDICAVSPRTIPLLGQPSAVREWNRRIGDQADAKRRP